MKRGLTLIELVIVVGIVLILVALVTSSISSVISRAEERKTKTGMELFALAIQEYESSTGRRLSMSGVYNVSLNPSGRAFDMRRAENHCLTTAEISRVLLRHQPSADILGRIDPSLIGNIRLGDDGNPPVWVPDTGLEFTCDPDLRVFASSNSFAAMNTLPYDPANSPYTGANALVLLDAWGSAIRAIHPGPQALVDASGVLLPQAFPPQDQNDGTESLQPDPDKTVARRVERLYIGRDNPDASIVLVSAGPDLKFGRRVDPTSGLPPTPDATGPYDCYLQALDNVYSTEVTE
ncbi:MAG: hypothetical protein CMJ30_05420 [Phycisphaerae bacterium]|nr:hypothetical protein [Phycisphaerae bacterium]